MGGTPDAKSLTGRNRRTVPWTLARVLKQIVWPVGEHREITFWVQIAGATLPTSLVLASFCLLWYWPVPLWRGPQWLPVMCSLAMVALACVIHIKYRTYLL